MTGPESEAFIAEHRLDFLDLCALVMAYAKKTNASLKWSGGRCVIHIKHLGRKKTNPAPPAAEGEE